MIDSIRKRVKEKRLILFSLILISMSLVLGFDSSFSYDEVYNNILNSGDCSSGDNFDFLVMIPPNGCQPSLVRSDLLSSQNTPVFCQLEAIKLNPLIESASITSISFQGDYPEEVAGISFHPTRAAIKNYNSLADNSISKNIGYVVILLKKQPNESKMEDWVSGVLTANIKYDYQKTYGVGQSDFYLNLNDNSNWDSVFNKYNFWSGRGYLRLKSIGSDSAEIEVLENKNKVYTNVILEEGNTSNTIYFPGDYCKAGFKLKLNEITSARDEVLLNINGDYVWVREGSRIANNNCIIKEINLKNDLEKDVKISCPGNIFTLSIKIKDIDTEITEDSSSEKDLGEHLKEAQVNLMDLLNSYPYEKDDANSFFGEIALRKQIDLPKIGKLKSELIDMFLKNYQDSVYYESIRSLKNNNYDYSLSENSFKLNNNNYFISFRDFISVDNSAKKATFSIDGVSTGLVNEGWRKEYTEGILTLKMIEHNFLIFEFQGSKDKIITIKVFEGEEKIINNLRINIQNINTIRTAHVSLLPVIESDYSKANFTFKIGIEKRLIQISPEIAQDRIESLNKTIESLDKFIEGFDKTLSVWKGTCITTSAIFNAKAFISGFSGEGIARKEVMTYYKNFCDGKISEGLFRTREGCYFEHSDEIEKNVQSYKESLGNVNEIIKEVQKGKGVVESGSIVNNAEYTSKLKEKITNPKIDKNELTTVTQIRSALLYQDLLKGDPSCESISCRLAKEEYGGSGINQNFNNDESISSGDICSNQFLNPQVRYYDSGKNKGLPSVVPLDLKGWYAYISNSEGSLIETEIKSYDTSGRVNYFYICNVGENGQMEYRGGDDFCQGFSSYQSSYDSIMFCPNMGDKDVSRLYNSAKEAIISASEQYGKNKVYILGNYFEVGQTMTDSGIFECTDFMSVKDCQTMFNICDPVLCPSSRCDAGGRYPVSNVPQQGIIGSLILCWPNKDEGIKIPICLTGINAGLQNLNSILKQTRQCLQTNIDTGEYVGVCDAITSVYFCNMFWEQSSLMINALSSPSNRVTGGVQGGGEYLFAQQNFQNMESALSNYISNYGDEILKAYKFENFESIGTEF